MLVQKVKSILVVYLRLAQSFANLRDFLSNVVLPFALFDPLLVCSLVVQLNLPQAGLSHLFLFSLGLLFKLEFFFCFFDFELCHCLLLFLLLLQFGLKGVPAA